MQKKFIFAKIALGCLGKKSLEVVFHLLVVSDCARTDALVRSRFVTQISRHCKSAATVAHFFGNNSRPLRYIKDVHYNTFYGGPVFGLLGQILLKIVCLRQVLHRIDLLQATDFCSQGTRTVLYTLNVSDQLDTGSFGSQCLTGTVTQRF